MTRIDFYILKDANTDLFACRLAEKIYKTGLNLFINTANQQSSQKLDSLLWTFREQSFVPHAILDANTSASDQVLLAHDREPDHNCQVLINLSNQVPNYFSRCERVAEVIANSDEAKKTGRERFKFYRDRGYQIQTHEI